MRVKFGFKKKIGGLSKGIAFQLYSFQWASVYIVMALKDGVSK
jgi:hypothetical protein